KTLTQRFEQNLLRLLEQGGGALEMSLKSGNNGRWSSRVTPAVTTTVSIGNRVATRETVLEVITRDRPGLLFELASTIQRAGLVISLAKINTEGHQVADVFYVSEPSGGKVTDPLRLAQLEDRIRAAVGSN
ncbi:MAG TPA: ACT domain-containing protein, partial [Polyangiaceae bacterium]